MNSVRSCHRNTKYRHDTAVKSPDSSSIRDQFNEISFELQMGTILMLMIFAVLLCYLSISERKA